MYFGDNQSKTKGIINATIKAQSYGGNCLQIFLRSPMRKCSLKVNPDDQSNCKQFLTNNNCKLVIHSSYLYNFCKNDCPWATTELVEELHMAKTLGAIGCIIHMGKTTTIPYETALGNFIANINNICSHVPSGVKLILENSAHQGTEIGYTIEQIAHIHTNILPENLPKIGYCLDTCHAFAAGYNLKTESRQFLEKFDEMIGKQYLECIHLNDSKKDCGCKVDRHENIDIGCIKKDGLKQFINVLKEWNFNGPIILETPDESTENRSREIDLLKND